MPRMKNMFSLDWSVLAKSMGFDAETIMTQFNQTIATVNAAVYNFDQRLLVIEATQRRILDMLESMEVARDPSRINHKMLIHSPNEIDD